jgi:hypothetical protein
MAELSLGVDAPAIQAAIAAFGSLNKEQQAAVLHAQGLVEAHRKLTGASRDAQKEMSAGWRTIAAELGVVTTMAGALAAALGAARQMWQQYKTETAAAGAGHAASVANFAQLVQMPELIGKPGTAAAIRSFIGAQTRRGAGTGADLYAAAGAAVAMGADLGDVQTATLAAARQKQLVPATDTAGFAKAYMASRKAGIAPAGAANLATLAGPGGGQSIAALAAIAQASGVSLPDLMALQETVAAELGKEPEEVQGMVARAVAGGVRLDEIVSGKIRGSTRRKLKNARGIQLLGALESGRSRFEERRGQFRAYAAGQGSVQGWTESQLPIEDLALIEETADIAAGEAERNASPAYRDAAARQRRIEAMKKGHVLPPSLASAIPELAEARYCWLSVPGFACGEGRGFWLKSKPWKEAEAAREDLCEGYTDEARRSEEPDIALAFIDPREQPKLAKEANVQVPGEMVVEYDGRREHLTTLDEQALTSMLTRLARNRERLVMFLDGHGERKPDGIANHDLGTLADPRLDHTR